MAGLYFEEFSEGQVFEHALTRTVTEMDNVLFTTLTMNPQPLHLDAEFAKTTEFGRPLVNSIFTLGLVIGISVGDTIRARTAVVSVRRSRSRSDAGIVEFEHVGLNQHGEAVAICRRAALMKTKAA
jgi:acyl dehydratase